MHIFVPDCEPVVSLLIVKFVKLRSKRSIQAFFAAFDCFWACAYAYLAVINVPAAASDGQRKLVIVREVLCERDSASVRALIAFYGHQINVNHRLFVVISRNILFIFVFVRHFFGKKREIFFYLKQLFRAGFVDDSNPYADGIFGDRLNSCFIKQFFKLIKSMADQVNEKKLEGISDIRDETDRTGMRIVIELKRDANPQVVLNRLFTQTQLQTSFAINMLALVNNQKQPKILSLRHILDEYLAYQEQVITRRTQYDLKKAREREHLLQGLLIAQDNIDEVIHIIRTSYDDAKEKLMARFDLSDIQAQAILEMRLKALQGLDREKLQNEYDELEKKIAYFVELLSNETMLKGVLKDELIEIRDKYGDERKTEIQDVEDEIDIEDLIEEEQCVFTLTQNGYIKRTGVSEYAAQGKGGMGKKGITTREEDTVVDVFTASTHDYILFFTDTGKVYRKKGYQIPESGKAAKGTNIVNIIQVETGERVQAMLHFREKGDEKLYLTMVTRNGTVKRLPVETLKNLRSNGIRALSLDEGDELVAVRETDGSQRILIATHDGMACVFDETDVRAMGRTAVGVRGIRLREGDYVVGAARAQAGKQVLSITENGFGKKTPVEEYRITNRGGLGIKNYSVTEKTGGVVGVKVVDGSEDLLLVTRAGILIRTPVADIRTTSRATQGVIVMRFKEEGDQVISMALAEHEEAPAPETAEVPTPVENADE